MFSSYEEPPVTHLLLSRDRLMNAPRKVVAQLCVRIFSRMEAETKEHQLLALAAAFVLLCDACNIPAQDVFTASKNLMANPDKEASARPLTPEFEAMAYHLRTDVLAK